MKLPSRSYLSQITDRNTKTFRAIAGIITYYDKISNIASVAPIGTIGDNLKNCYVSKGLSSYITTGTRCIVLFSESHNSTTAVIIAVY